MGKSWALLTLALVVGVGSPVFADPINITGGHMVFQRQDLASIVVHGNGAWSVDAVFGTDESYYPGISSAPMPAGALVAVSQYDSFTNAPGVDRFVGGTYTVGGTVYWLDSLDFFLDDLAGVRVPSDSTGIETWTDMTRFNFRAFLAGTSDLGARVEAQLTGRGSARLATLDNYWLASAYTFDDQAPVPEPGTLLLFATGAAAVIRRRLRSAP